MKFNMNESVVHQDQISLKQLLLGEGTYMRNTDI